MWHSLFLKRQEYCWWHTDDKLHSPFAMLSFSLYPNIFLGVCDICYYLFILKFGVTVFHSIWLG